MVLPTNLNCFKRWLNLSTYFLALAIFRVESSSAALKLVLPFKNAGMLTWACKGFTRSCTVNPLSASIMSPGSICFRIPLSSKSYTSEMSPSNKSDTKHAPPLGVTAIMHLKVFPCLYDEYVFPCLPKFLDVSTLNSVQSTLHLVFFIVLKTLGKYFLSLSLEGNITLFICLKILYIIWMKVVNISLMEVSFISFPG